MGVYHVKQELLGEVLGVADECPGCDESALSTLNVRLEQMWREEIRGRNNVVHLHADDLEKLAHHDKAWRAGAKTLTAGELRYKQGDPLDTVLRMVNRAPAQLADELGAGDRLTFAHSPVFHFKRSRTNYTIQVWMHVVFAPVSMEDIKPPAVSAGAEKDLAVD